jgi:hypothetical protein
VGVAVPAIISKELFERVQKRREDNRARYRNPPQVHLLSTLVRCGGCGGSVYALRGWQRSQRKGPLSVIHTSAYRCNWNFRVRLHSKHSRVNRCRNPQIKSALLEGRVLATVRDVMLHPQKLRKCVDFITQDVHKAERRIGKELKSIQDRIEGLNERKRRVIEIYASGDLTRDAYVEKNREYDAETHG